MSITRPIVSAITAPPLSSLSGQAASTYVNLLQYSEQFDNAAWVKTNAAVTANAIVAPDGASSADKVTETATTAIHKAHQAGVVNQPGVLHELACHFKAAERTRGQLILQDASFNGVVTNFNLTTGTTTAGALAGTGWTSPLASIEALADGWYRLRLSGVSSSVGTIRGDLLMADAAGVTSYLGVVNSGMYLWGAMITRGAGLPYKASAA